MAPINKALSDPTGGPAVRPQWKDRLGQIDTGIDQIITAFGPQGPLTIVLPAGFTVPWGGYVSTVIRNGSDMADYQPGVFNFPSGATEQFRALEDETRGLLEIRQFLQQSITKIDGILQSRKDQMCQVAGVIVYQIKGLDGTAILTPEQRQAVDKIKGPIYAILDANNASVHQLKMHNQHLIAHGDQKAAAVAADLKVSQAENQVLRGGALGKDSLQAPPAPAGLKKSGRKGSVHKPAKPAKAAKHG